MKDWIATVSRVQSHWRVLGRTMAVGPRSGDGLAAVVVEVASVVEGRPDYGEASSEVAFRDDVAGAVRAAAVTTAASLTLEKEEVVVEDLMNLKRGIG